MSCAFLCSIGVTFGRNDPSVGTVANAQCCPSLRSDPTPLIRRHLSICSSCLLRSHIFFCSPSTSPHVSHFVSRLCLFFFFASFFSSIPLPLSVTSAFSLPGDLQRRKEASPFSLPLLLNTCYCYKSCETLCWHDDSAVLSFFKTVGVNVLHIKLFRKQKLHVTSETVLLGGVGVNPLARGSSFSLYYFCCI